MRVETDYARHDLARHAAEVAESEGCLGQGITLFTAASVDHWRRGERQGVTVDATVGASKPTWAADESQGHGQWAPGTINLVAWLPVAMSEAAAVNMVITATEAKTQALFDAGVPGTGTASDAIVLLWPASPIDTIAGVEPEPFGGPRSTWGSQLALATHDAVSAALAP